jgi:CRISPR/Cas system-associated exonuclease Cas4 (RecB family)
MSQENHSTIISASEIGEYVYCSRSFWLHREYPEFKETAPKKTFLDLFRARENRLEIGIRLHAKQAAQVKRQAQLRKVAYLLVLIISLFIIVTLGLYLVWKMRLLFLPF